MSSSGAAVGFPGANADSTGVTMRASVVGDGSGDEIRVVVWVAEGALLQAAMININDEFNQSMKKCLFI